MTVTLKWGEDVPSLMMSTDSGGAVEVACVRKRRNGYDFVRYVGPMRVSAPYESEPDARQDAESDVRRLLKDAGIEVDP